MTPQLTIMMMTTITTAVTTTKSDLVHSCWLAVAFKDALFNLKDSLDWIKKRGPEFKFFVQDC